MSEFKFEVGLKAKDLVTGFEGVISCRSQWISGCNTYGLKPKVDKDGKLPQSEYFDENTIEITDKKVLELGTTVDNKIGGPQETPRQPNH